MININKLHLIYNFKRLWLLHRWTLVVMAYVIIVWLTTPVGWSHTDTYFKAVTLRQLSILLVPLLIIWMLINFFNKQPITVDLNDQVLLQANKIVDLTETNCITVIEKPVMRSVEIVFSKNGYRVAKIPAWFIDDVSLTGLACYHYAKKTGKKFTVNRKRVSPLKGSIV